jgi:hypothetical protein
MMFSSMRIRVGFQPEPQLMFHCTIVGVKPRFMAMSLFATPSQRLIAKNRLCCNTHALLQTCQLTRLALNAQSSQQPTSFQDSLLGQVDILQPLIYHI